MESANQSGTTVQSEETSRKNINAEKHTTKDKYAPAEDIVTNGDESTEESEHYTDECDIDDGPYEVVDDAGMNDDDLEFENNDSIQSKSTHEDDVVLISSPESDAQRTTKTSASKDGKDSRKRKLKEDLNNAKSTVETDKIKKSKPAIKLTLKDKSASNKSEALKKEKAKSKVEKKDGSKEKDKKIDLKHKDRSKSAESRKSHESERGKSKELEKERNKKDGSKSKEIKKDTEATKQQKHQATLEKFWKTVKEDPNDFTGWTYLLQYVDQENDVESAKEVFNNFLSLYPYCYGYWRKYADLFKRNGFHEECNKTFERGIESVPLSVDLWLHYVNHYKTILNENELRNVYKRAIESCGKDYKSDRLWESYIKWEIDLNNLQNVINLFDQWLSTPTLLSMAPQNSSSVLDRFKVFLKKYSPSDILPPEEFFTFRNEMLKEVRQAKDSNSDDNVPIEDISEEEATNKFTDEELNIIRNKILSTREEIYKKTYKDFESRAQFEDGIKRPYFHVKPLEASQLSNWRDYLKYEISVGNSDKVIFLFERCLIACALYEYFWLEYVSYLEGEKNTVDKTRDVYHRACMIHHQTKIRLHKQWAYFEEKQGNFDKAAEILDNFNTKSPGKLTIILHRINLERRKGNMKKVEELFDSYIADKSLKPEIILLLQMKYAAFCAKNTRDISKAVDILKKAIENNKFEMRLYLRLINTYMKQPDVNISSVIEVFNNVLSLDVSNEWKLIFSQRKLQFLEDYSCNFDDICQAYKEYCKYEANNSQNKKTADKAKEDTPPTSAACASSTVAADASATTNSNSTVDAPSRMQTPTMHQPPPPPPPPPHHATPYAYPPQHAAAPYQANQMYSPQSTYGAPPPNAYTQMYNSDPNYNYAAYYNNSWQATYNQYNTTWPNNNPAYHNYSYYK